MHNNYLDRNVIITLGLEGKYEGNNGKFSIKTMEHKMLGGGGSGSSRGSSGIYI